jgi:DEAD/DEAH box helicase domain-containing protein
MKNIVYFDLETQRSADEVGGWNHKKDMGMSIGVTYSSAENEYRIFDERRVQDLIKTLFRADLVVGFNIVNFDYEVLHGYTPLDLGQIPTLDLMVEIAKGAPFRPSLDGAAQATLGAEKVADGLQAIRWYREGKLVEIAEYCCYDVKITRLLHEYGRENRQVFFMNKFGQKLSAKVDW